MLTQRQPTALKKKKKDADDDDLFGGGDETLFDDSGELFSASESTEQKTTKTTKTARTPLPDGASRPMRLRGRLNYEQRLEKFDELFAFVDERIGRKIRDAEMAKTPYLLVVGEKEAQDQLVSVRRHGEGDIGSMPIASFVESVQAQIAAAME